MNLSKKSKHKLDQNNAMNTFCMWPYSNRSSELDANGASERDLLHPCSNGWCKKQLHRGHKSKQAVAIARRTWGHSARWNLDPLADEPPPPVWQKVSCAQEVEKNHPERPCPLSRFNISGAINPAGGLLGLLRPFCDTESVSHARPPLFLWLKSVRNCSMPGIILLGRLCYINQKSVTRTEQRARGGGTKPWVDFLASDVRTDDFFCSAARRNHKAVCFWAGEAAPLPPLHLNLIGPPLVFNFIFPPNRAQRPQLSFLRLTCRMIYGAVT